MFLFANILLAGLFAAGCWLAGANLLEYRSLKALVSLQGEERWLFGSWQKERRPQWGQWAFCLILLCMAVEQSLLASYFNVRYVPSTAFLRTLCDFGICVGVFIKVLFCTRYSLRQMAVGFCGYFIIRWVYFNCHDLWLILAVLLVLSAKDIDFHRALSFFLFALCSGMAVVFWMYFTWQLGNVDFALGYQNKFGFNYHNTLGGLVLGLCLGWLLRRGRKFSLPECLLMGGIGAFTLIIIRSRSAGLCIILLAIGSIAERCLRPFLRKLPFALAVACIPGIFTSIWFLLPRLAQIDPLLGVVGPGWLVKVDSLLSHRVLYTRNSLEVLSLRIAGQPILDTLANDPSKMILHPDGDYFYPMARIIDCIYLHSLYYFGPVLFLMLWLACGYLLYQLMRQGQTVFAMALAVMCVYGFMETQFLHTCVNMSLLLFANIIWGKLSLPFADRSDPS